MPHVRRARARALLTHPVIVVTAQKAEATASRLIIAVESTVLPLSLRIRVCVEQMLHATQAPYVSE